MSCKIDSYILANTLGVCQKDILANMETAGTKTFLTESDQYFSDRKIFVGKINICLSEHDQSEYGVIEQNDQFMVWAYLQMREKLDFLKRKYGKERIGLVVGTSTAGIYNLESAVFNKKDNNFPVTYQYNRSETSFLTDNLKRLFGLTGPAYTISTSCTSSLKAISSAMSLLNCGFCDAVVTGGIDTLCNMTVKGFDSLELLSNSIAKPMSTNRDGINIGEGIAFCILTSEPGGIRIKGIGESCDTYHVTSPDPEGLGACNAMKMAMDNSGLSKEEVDYIQLHGTGTNFNDISEAKAIFNIWGSSIKCSSIKPLTGHTLGISGIMGVLLCTMTLEQSKGNMFLPMHIWDQCPDENIPQISLLDSNTSVNSSGPLNFMINNFAFGGNNCSVIIGEDQ